MRTAGFRVTVQTPTSQPCAGDGACLPGLTPGLACRLGRSLTSATGIQERSFLTSATDIQERSFLNECRWHPGTVGAKRCPPGISTFSVTVLLRK